MDKEWNKIMLDIQRDRIKKKMALAGLFISLFLISAMILVILRLFL